MRLNGNLGVNDQMPSTNGYMPGIKDSLASTDMGINPRPNQINPYIKDSGAPVNFDPRSAQNINSMFGTPMENSYDRTMTPYDGSNYDGDQQMY